MAVQATLAAHVVTIVRTAKNIAMLYVLNVCHSATPRYLCVHRERLGMKARWHTLTYAAIGLDAAHPKIRLDSASAEPGSGKRSRIELLGRRS